jgi:hypothetical protein
MSGHVQIRNGLMLATEISSKYCFCYLFQLSLQVVYIMLIFKIKTIPLNETGQFN